MKNDIIKKVVLFTIRDIEKTILFRDKAPEKNIRIINYFLGFSELKEWLDGRVSVPDEVSPSSNRDEIDLYFIKQEWGGHKEELKGYFDLISGALKNEDLFANIIKSLPSKIDNAKSLKELRRCKSDYSTATISKSKNFSNEQKTAHAAISLFFDNIKNNYQDPNKGKRCFSESHYEELKDYELMSEKTYCDKWDGVKVKHRLGMYCKEEDEIAVCAIFPWMGDYEDNHDKLWTQMLVGSVLEFYHNVETIILVCHDMDFKLYAEKDFVVSRNINEDNKYTRNYTARIIEIPLVVFQHSHSEITSTLSKSSTMDVYTSMENYVSGFVEIQNSDTDKKNAKAHEEKYKS